MTRPRQFFRDFGLTLALLTAAALLYFNTTLPALKRNAELDQKRRELDERKQELSDEIERLKAEEAAIDDPIERERLHRARFGDLDLPANERTIPAEPAGPGARGEK